MRKRHHKRLMCQYVWEAHHYLHVQNQLQLMAYTMSCNRAKTRRSPVWIWAHPVAIWAAAAPTPAAAPIWIWAWMEAAAMALPSPLTGITIKMATAIIRRRRACSMAMLARMRPSQWTGSVSNWATIISWLMRMAPNLGHNCQSRHKPQTAGGGPLAQTAMGKWDVHCSFLELKKKEYVILLAIQNVGADNAAFSIFNFHKHNIKYKWLTMHFQGRHTGSSQQAGKESSCALEGMFRTIKEAIATNAGWKKDIEPINSGQCIQTCSGI